MTENPMTPTAASTPHTTEPSATPGRTWRDRLPRRLPTGRKTLAAGAVMAGLAIGGAGFGAGYAVGDNAADTATTQTTDTDWGGRGYPGDGRGRPAEMPGAPAGGTMQEQDGTTDESPDFDGDGSPDTDSSLPSDDSTTQQS